MKTIDNIKSQLLEIVQSYKDTHHLSNNDLIECLGIDRIGLVRMYQDNWNPTLTEIFNIIEKCDKNIVLSLKRVKRKLILP